MEFQNFVEGDKDIRAISVTGSRKKIYNITGIKHLKLFCYPSGAKIFKIKYKTASGVYSCVTIGEFKRGKYGLQTAIDDAALALAKLSLKKVNSIKGDPVNFQELWESYKVDTKDTRSHLKTLHRIIMRFENTLLSLIKDIPLNVLRDPIKVRPIFLDALKSLQTRDNPRTTVIVKVINQLNLCLDHACIRGILEVNPVRLISQNFKSHFIVSKPENRKAILKISDLQQFFAAVNNYFGDPIVKDCMKWTIMYVVRPTNARTAKWSQIDFKNKEWRIEGSSMKMGEDFVLPLTDTAVKFLKNLHNYKYQTKEYIFSSVGCTKPMSEGTMRMALNRMGFKGEVHMHGFRSTFRTMMSEMNFEKKLGFTEEVLSLCIDHKFRKVVRSDEAYHRAKFEDGKRKAFTYLSKFLNSSRASSKSLSIFMHSLSLSSTSNCGIALSNYFI